MAKPRVEQAPGGEWHIYRDGRRVFVRHKQASGGMTVQGQHAASGGVGGRAAAPGVWSPAWNTAWQQAWLKANPGQTPPWAQGAPGAAGGQGAAAAPPQPPGLGEDAESVIARAAALQQRTQRLGELDTQGRYDRQDLDEALRRMAGQRPKDEQTTREGANRQGLFYSGQLGKRMDELATEYARREGDQRQALERREAARVAARQAIEQGAPIEDAAITAALADRQINRDTEAADSRSLVRETPLTPAVPATPAAPRVPQVRRPAAPKARPVVKNNRFYRYYGTGPKTRKVYVRPAGR